MHSIDYSLLRGYQILGEEAQTLFGYYPVKVVKPEANDIPKFRIGLSGELRYRLPGRNCLAAGELILPPVARTDGFATSLAVSFAKACDRMRHEVHKVGDVGLYFVRHDKYIRDSLLVTRTHKVGKKLFLIDTIAALRDALSYRYEGVAVDVGAILTWNWTGLEATLIRAGCTILKFTEGFNLRHRLGRAKASYLLADGITSFYVATPEAYVDRLVVLPSRIIGSGPPEWQLVPHEYHCVHQLIKGHDVFLNVNRRGELWMFTQRAATKWAGNRWHRVSAPPLTAILSEHVSVACAERIAELVAFLSVRRIGALIVLGKGLAEVTSAVPSGIRLQFDRSWNPQIGELSVEFLARLAGIDGATLIAQDGTLVDAGVILRIPMDHKVASEGARTAAASFAGSLGLAVKVSHDGPVSVYDKSGLRFQAA